MQRPDIDVLLDRLRQSYPDARYELDWDTPVHMLVATILAAQCTDERVNAVTKTLFPRYPDAQAFADADLAELEEAVRPTGTFRQKAKAIKSACRMLVDEYGGEVPQSIEALVRLPGVARKTANVVLATCFNIPSGVIVDTHVIRLAGRMGLSEHSGPQDIERDLMRLVPQDDWTFFGPAMILLGRYVCTAKKPDCPNCVMQDICPKIGVAR
ncbi:DNA-(apurinic or apyrimidinic site) lyase /endonuclease III [Nannocystis exedens]|uniref:Endonuclease III n=1 Tax=Nannocystis exedens TaxID=54 RepID=A0A1I2EGT0_9BACT|nr:endonuclease III [Nannocystis exedens]PCC74736.1 endonuclease III [Nannocystis exedens]SFE91756.1 DNA-(apurinic or apyrimidinic site) lyase /endonuclease III [Nannocystis exedens]